MIHLTLDYRFPRSVVGVHLMAVQSGAAASQPCVNCDRDQPPEDRRREATKVGVGKGHLPGPPRPYLISGHQSIVGGRVLSSDSSSFCPRVGDSSNAKGNR